MSWDLKVGEIKEKYITEDDIWVSLNTFYFASTFTMSYKYGFLKSLIENLYNVNDRLELNFNYIFYSFTKIYWNLVVHHNFWQSNNPKQISSIQKVLIGYAKDYSIPKEMTFDKLPKELQLRVINDIKKYGKRYVIGAFYSDTNKFFYEFDLKKEYFRFNPPVYKFLQKHQRIIIYMTNYQLAKFLEKYNSIPNTNYLLDKIEVVSKRNSLKEYFQILSEFDEDTCFYCKKTLKKGIRAIHVDHFIPWSFIQNDHLWNLVLSCQTSGQSKVLQP